jgi:archaellum component FlaC
MHLEAGLRAAQAAELTALGVVQRGLLGTVQSVRETQLQHGATLGDQTRRLEELQVHADRVDAQLDSLDAMVDNVDLHVEEVDLKVERILEILEPVDG